MKKIVSLLLVIIITCSALAGCGKLIPWNNKLKTEVIEDYLSWSGLKGDYKVDEIDYHFLGKYGDSVAIYFKTAGAYETPTEEEVAGYKFSYPDSRVIRIWNNGKFYKIADAYEKGLVKPWNVKRISSKAKSLNHGDPIFIFEEKVSYKHVFSLPGYVFLYDRVDVRIDTNLSKPGKIFDNEFFEDVGITKIVDWTRNSDPHRVTPYRQYLELHLAEASIENVKRVVDILEAKEGIRSVEPGSVAQPGATPNDEYYTSSDSQQGTWGLYNIEVEKVWDFTTGSSAISVGVVDTGLTARIQ